MFSTLFSLLPSRFSRPILSLLVLAAVILALQPTARAQTFSSSGSISIPNGSANNVPTAYPTSGTCTNNAACIAVSGLTGTYTSMSITLNYSSLNSNSFGFPAILLESPSGTAKLDILSFGCAYELTPASVTFTLSDSGTSLFPPAFDPDNENCPSGLANGTYEPAAYEVTNDFFPSPGPGSSYTVAGNGSNPCSPSNPGTPNCPTGNGTFANTFCSSPSSCVSSLNGTWKLYAVDQANGAAPTVFTWSLTFNVTANNAATTTTLTAGSPNPAFTSGTGSSVSFPVTVTESASPFSPVTNGTVTLVDTTTNTNLASHTFVSADNGSFTFTETLTTEGTHVLQANYVGGTGFANSSSGNVTQTAVNHATPNPSQAGSFCNSGPITLSSNAGGNPYPSLIVLGPTNIAGDTEPTLSGTISSVSVTLNGLNLQNGVELDDLGVMLQAPGATSPTTFTSSGNAFEFLSWAGNPYTSGSLTFSDDGTATIPFEAAPTCTTCLPTDDTVDLGADHPDTFPSPAPATFVTAPPTGSGTFLTQFGGGGVSGTWSLYLVNRLSTGGTLGSLGSWCLNFTTQINAHPTMTSVSGSPNPASTPASTPASVALTAHVSVTDTSALTVDGGTVTFVDGATNLGSAPVANGQATLNVSLAEGTHQIVASYGGTDTGTEFGISTATFDQRVNTATTIPPSTSSGAGPYTFCNPGAIVAPGLNNDLGPASPYPSNIFVTNLPGTVKAVTVTLNGFTTKDQGDLLSLLVGPGGNNLDFFSLTGSNISNAPSPFNLTFADGGATISGNLSSSGTFAPTSFNTDIAYPQCPPNAPLCANPSMPVGPPLASNPFTPTNKAAAAGTAIFGNANEEGVFGGTTSSTYNGNGTWSLYLDDGGPTAGGDPINVNSGWCVSLTQNLPSISVAAQQPSTFTQNGTGSFPVTITNEGAGSIGDPTATAGNAMTVTDGMPVGLTYSGFTGTDWSCTAGGQTVVCTNQDTVAAGATFNALSINANVSSAASGAIGNNTVSVTDAEAASNPAPSSGAVTIDVPPGISSATSTTFISGMAGSFTVTTTAGTYPTAALGESGGLPGTVTFTDNRDGTATLAGTPGAANSFGITITAQNGVLPNATQNFTLNVLPGLASRFAITVPPTATVGAAFNFTVTAYDAFGNQATGYNGTVHFSSSDPGVLLPANAALTNGTGTFSAKLMTPGTQTITATDTVNPGLTITSSGILVNAPNFGRANVCAAGQTTPAPCSNTQTFSFNIPAGTTIGSISILTTGAANLDFQPQANDTSITLCKAQTYSSATTCTVDVTFAPIAPGQRNGAVQIVDGSGNILATTYIYGTGVGPAITFQSGALVGLGSGITAVTVAVDASGNVYVGDQGNSTLQVQELLAAGGYTTINTLASGFDAINGLAVDGSGNVFVADSLDHEVYEIPAVGGSIPINNPSQAIPLLSFDFNMGPYGVAVDGNGNLYVADNGVNMVYEIPSVNGSITYPANPTFITLGSNFNSPQGVAVDGSGNVFVSDYGNHAVKEILAAGGYTTVNTLTSNLPRPQGVAVDASGNVYVSNTFDAAYEILAVNGSVPSNPTIITLNTLGSDAFTDPTDVAVDARGNVYVADPYSTQITKLDMADPPTLSFASTTVGATSSDSPKSIQFQNVGNATLTGSGILSDTADFTVVPGPGVVPNCTISTVSLAPGAECNLSIDFTPQSAAPISATIALSDNALNGNPATQTIQLGGIGTIAATNTTLRSSPNPALLGQSVTFTATVTPKSSGPVPTGTVNFEHLGFVIGTETLTNGVASFTTSTLPANVADHIVAVYSGSATYTGSTSVALAQAVTGNPTTTTLMSSSNPSVLGQPITFIATVAITGHVPIGTVIFKHLGAVLATETLSNGVASFTTSTLPLNAADHITAEYSGSATDTGSTSAVLAQTVNKNPTTTTLMSSSNPSVLGQPVMFTATVAATFGPVPSGTVRFEHLGALLGTGTLSNGVASITTSALPANVADHIVAVYSGGAEDIGSTSAALAQTVH